MLSLSRLLFAVAVLIIAGILMVAILGPILVATDVPFVVIVGAALVKWGWLLALGLAIYAYFRGFALPLGR